MKSFPARPSASRCHGAFALVTTLLILSLLTIVAVSYLSSMSAERQTAEAYGSRASAEQAAQTGVDNATAMLAECFRDFPDSATVWDTTQTTNSGTPYNAAIVGGNNNEGTSLYLRAVPSASGSSTAYAVPLPAGVTYANGGTSYTASNDPNGNDPNNPACQNFVLPLVSGVPSGQARLVSAKSSIWTASTTPALMNLNEPDPTKQNWIDLNVRRSSTDVQGVIGSPPAWAGAGPKPARAYWVNLKGSNGLVTGRYAFWIEDESFRANNSLLGNAGQPPDNTARPLDSATSKPRVATPDDLTLVGPLTAAGTNDPSSTANSVVTSRKQSYPGGFFPDRLAFSHVIDRTTASGLQTIDSLRYLTTNQSSALNLSRHGSQRLNLNTPISDVQKQVNLLVQSLEYHLPNFGERFYRTSASALNDATQVPGSPYAGSYSSASDGSRSQIYYYKVAANLRDYVDTDSQPTIIGTNGTLMTGPPSVPLDESGNNQIWAQGKESSPYIQEVAVRYRPVVTTTSHATATNPKGHYKLNVDYYVEFWNMSNRDIAAADMGDLAIWVRDQQPWGPYYSTYLLQSDTYPPNGEALRSNQTPNDTKIDLVGSNSNPVKDGNGTAQSRGVVFRAGTVTVVTTDPDCATYTYKEPTNAYGFTGKTNNPSFTNPSGGSLPNLSYVFVCPVVAGSRIYSGKITNTDGSVSTNGGIELGGDYLHSTPYTGTEVSLVNSQGYFDVVRGAITKTGGPGYYLYTNTDSQAGTQGGYNDFSFGSSMMGNVADSGGPTPVAAASQLGDPRTNNEQLLISINSASADGTCFMPATRTLGSPNYPGVQPDTTTTGQGWPDYYKFPGSGTSHPSPDATTAPAVIAGALSGDGLLTSVGQLGDVFDPVRAPGLDIRSSHGGGRTFKIGQHDDLYSDDPTTNIYSGSNSPTNTVDSVPASSGWASWRLADIFDVADPIQLPARININGVMRDNGAALLSALQGFVFQPTTVSGTSDPIIHGDGSVGLAGKSLDTTGSASGFSQIFALMKQRLDAATAARVKPFFERGEFGELGGSGNPLFGTTASSSNTALVSGIDMNKTADHSREEVFRRLAQMICTRGNTFTVYAVGQSILQTKAAGPLKITGTQRMRVTFRLVPKAKDLTTGDFADFHPAYTIDASGVISQNNFDPSDPTRRPRPTQNGQVGVIPRFAKPDRYDAQVLEVATY